MIITCRNCNTSFTLGDEFVKDTGSKVKCSKCTYIFKVFPPHIHTEPDGQQNDLSLNVEENTSTKPYLSSGLTHTESTGINQKSEIGNTWDLSEIEKILQEENGQNFDRESLEGDSGEEYFDDFDLSDLDDIFDEKDFSDDPGKEEHAAAADKETVLSPGSNKTADEEIDLSQLDDLFKEDALEETSLEFDTIDEALSPEFGLKKAEGSDLESEEAVTIDDIDLSELDKLFSEDEHLSLHEADSPHDLDIMTQDDDETLSIDKFLDDEAEISLTDGSDQKTDEINLSELDEFFRNETDGSSDFNFEMEKDVAEDPLSDQAPEDPDFDLSGNTQDQALEFDTAELEYGAGQKAKDSDRYEDKSAIDDFKFDFTDPEKKDETPEPDEEFDLSDLEEIIDLEEIAEADAKFSESKNEDDDRELVFDLSLDPDIDDGGSIKLVLEKESEIDASEKTEEAESEISGEIQDTEFSFQRVDDIEESSVSENDDYNLEETEEKPHRVFGTAESKDPGQIDEEEEMNIEDEEPKPKSKVGVLVLVALVLALLAAAGYAVIGIMGKQIPGIGSYMKTETPDPGNLKMVAYDLNSKFEENRHAGKIFIITGVVKNEYAEPRSFVKIMGKLYEPAKKMSHTEQVFAGNIFSELELRSLDMDAIKNRLNNRLGQNNSNINIKPGQSLPFMIIFSHLPDKLEEFTVEIDSSSPA